MFLEEVIGIEQIWHHRLRVSSRVQHRPRPARSQR
jgi:hypothetical protein